LENLQKTILIAAGGTGGHIFPGLAVAKNLIVKGYKVAWIGTLDGLESALVPKNNIPIYYIKITGFRGKGLFTKLLAPFYILLAIFQAIQIIKLLNPHTILGMGGFVSGPAGIAAWLLRKKLIIHEQNAIAGTSNRILVYFASYILESFPNSFSKNLSKKYLEKIILTGLPVRADLLATPFPEHRNNNKNINNTLNVLVIGGSRGAQFLNTTIPKALADLENIKIVHQTGEKECINTQELYAKYSKQNIHQIKPFIDNMLAAYLCADLVICRAGASTIFEIMAIGVAAILIPLPWAIDDHQTKNALYLVNNNAGILLKQQDITVDLLKKLIIDLKTNKNKLYAMQFAARSLYKKYELNNSTDFINSVVES
jgi:UDP-N-acetylglucosamine--N-acetylmuramyl-(pentapeptide) pyrophosphoryl-undecaprenol N-acetylglucosamine transferase